MVEDERNSVSVNQLIQICQEKGMETFVFEWDGDKVPEKVTFPNGLERTIQYMRGGSISFF